MSLRAEFDIQGVEGVLTTLQMLPHELVSKRGGAVKLSLRKGAIFLAAREKDALRSKINADNDSTGLLVDNIIASRGKEPRGTRGERYIVRIKRRTYPDRTGKPVTTLKVAHIFEYGAPGNNQPADPFIRPTAIQYHRQVISIVTTDLLKRVDKIVKKLERQNAARGRR